MNKTSERQSCCNIEQRFSTFAVGDPQNSEDPKNNDLRPYCNVCQDPRVKKPLRFEIQTQSSRKKIEENLKPFLIENN